MIKWGRMSWLKQRSNSELIGANGSTLVKTGTSPRADIWTAFRRSLIGCHYGSFCCRLPFKTRTIFISLFKVKLVIVYLLHHIILFNSSSVTTHVTFLFRIARIVNIHIFTQAFLTHLTVVRFMLWYQIFTVPWNLFDLR